jgi:hypothetical protein
MRRISTLTLSLVLTLAGGLVTGGVVRADEPDDSGAGSPRSIFDTEICKVDGLSAAECDCAWKVMASKLSAGDLKLAMLLTASNSDNAETAKKADEALEKIKPSEKRQDALASESSAMVVEAEDSCGKK